MLFLASKRPTWQPWNWKQCIYSMRLASAVNTGLALLALGLLTYVNIGVVQERRAVGERRQAVPPPSGQFLSKLASESVWDYIKRMGMSGSGSSGSDGSSSSSTATPSTKIGVSEPGTVVELGKSKKAGNVPTTDLIRALTEVVMLPSSVPVNESCKPPSLPGKFKATFFQLGKPTPTVF